MTSTDERPLTGLRILDFSRVLAGPYLTQLFAALGADVVKVESPSGDPTRIQGPPIHRDASYYFHGTNRGKRSLVLDLESTAGRDLARKLASSAAAIVENFRPGVLGRLGLDPADLRRADPGLVVLSISGCGNDAPPGDRDRPSFDLSTQARGGAISINGRPGELPSRLAIPMGDLAGAFFGGIALLASLLRSARGGRGATIDVSLLDSQVALLGTWISLASLSGRSPGPIGSAHASAMPYDVYEAADSPFVVAVFTDRFWLPFTEAIGRAELSGDARYSTGALRVANRADLDADLRPFFKTRNRAEWLQAFARRGVPADPVASILEALRDRALEHRGMVRWDSEGDSRLAEVAFPALIDGNVGFAGAAPEQLGGDRDSVLRDWLALNPSEIAELESANAFGSPARG
jgi:crotonobetainyl-CoA:carnitine CoA-transferase CaiB-like acyl-CoA transferase